MFDGGLRLFSFILSLSRLCAGTLTPYRAPAAPLAVKSPYLNTWSPLANSGQEFTEDYASFWNVANQTAWIGAVRIDGVPYTVMGGAPFAVKAQLDGIDITPASSSFLVQAAGVFVNMTFLSPITPTDLVRQSLPFTYLSVNVTSSDGEDHDIQVYTEMTPEWLTSDWDLIARWNSTVESGIIVHEIQLENQTAFTDIGGFAQGASVYYAMSPVSAQTYQVGYSATLRKQFNSTGTLSNTDDTDFRAIDNDWPSMAISADLGTISSTGNEPVVFTVGLINNPTIQYAPPNGSTQIRYSYFWSNFTSALDSRISRLLSAAGNVSSQLSDLVHFATRQVMASLEITISKDEEGGGWNTSDVMVFQKDFDTGAANQVDVLYSAFPALLFLNPDVAGYALTPLLEYGESPLWKSPFAPQNLGTYPNATGNPSPHNLGIEESANMIVMALAHAQVANDVSLLSTHYALLSRWANYLESFALRPGSQTGPYSLPTVKGNQTNLALKGILGVAAMSQVSSLTNNGADAQRYNQTADSLLQQWIKLSVPDDANTIYATYESTSSSAMAYNLFVDQLLGLGVVPDSVYQAQVVALTQLHQSNFGIAIDTNNANYTAFDAMMMTAAAMKSSSASVPSTLISKVHGYLTGDQNDQSLFSAYSTGTGKNFAGANSPTVGAVFAMLVPSITRVSSPPEENNAVSVSALAGAIVGAVIGALAVLAIAVLVFLYLRRQSRARKQSTLLPIVSPSDSSSSIVRKPRNGVFSLLQHPTESTFVTETPATTISPAAYPRKHTTLPMIVTAMEPAWSPPAGAGRGNLAAQTTSSSAVGGSVPDPEASQIREEMNRLRQEMRQEIEGIRRVNEVPPAYEPEFM